MEDIGFTFSVLSAAGGSGFIHGFNIAVLNILSPVVMKWYKDLQELRDVESVGFYEMTAMTSFMTAAFSLGAIFGSCLIYLCAHFMGRKSALLINNSLVLFAVVLLSFSQLSLSFEVFILGRVIMGVATGISSGIAPIYLIEISPDSVRGTVGSFYYVMVSASIALTYCLSLPTGLGTEESWSLMFILCIVPSLCQIISLVFCPESPKYLLLEQEDDEAAEEALAWLRPDDELDLDMEELRDEAAELDEIPPVTFDKLFADQSLRSPLVICSVIMIGQQACGVDGMIYFSCEILTKWGFEHEKAANITIGMGVCLFVATVICMVLVDKVGRKPLLLGSFGGMIFCKLCIVLLVLLTTFVEEMPHQVRDAATVFLVLYVFTFGLGAGTISWYLTAELCNHFARPMAVTVAVTLNWVVHFVIAISFVPLLIAVSHRFVFLIFLVFDIATLMFGLLTLRETNQMNVIDIIELFQD